MLKLLQNGIKKGAGNISINYFRLSKHSISVSALENSTAVADLNKDEPVEMENPFEKEKKICILCEMAITPNYKNVRLLSQFQSPYTGRIYSRHITGLCKSRQEQVENAIVRAQNCALMPSYHKDVKYLNDPKLFDPERPLRPHKY